MLSMKESRSHQLVEALNQKRLVRFSRRFEDASIRGYVSSVGPKWFLLALVSDRIRFDGFECFRIADAKSLVEDPYAEFVEAALKKRKEKKPKTPAVKLGSIEELLLSANRRFPLVTIHLEAMTPEICHIGRVLGVEGNRVSLLEIGPDASWASHPSEYDVRKITRVNFGGGYEDALHIVGGNRDG
jgi:hypothetical protein